MSDAELITTITSSLGQFGLSVIFVAAWWKERLANSEATKAHIRDLRRMVGKELQDGDDE